MTYISINRTAIEPESAAEFERIAAQWRRSERERLPLNELIARQLVRADSGSEYAEISVWGSREAHERNEDSPAEREVFRVTAAHLTGMPEQLTGEVVSDVR